MSGITYREAYLQGREQLLAAEVPEAEQNARLLLEYVCKTDRQAMLLAPERVLSAEEEQRYREVTAKRARRIPLQHITGSQYFMGLEFAVDGRVLVPRPDTEILVEEVLKDNAVGAKILDLCTGSGCILLSILKYANSAGGTGTDLSEEALAVAQANAGRLQIPAAFYRGDLFAALPEAEKGFDIIVSNPPYIETAEIAALMPEVREHDPYMALDGGADGLDFYRRIIAEAPAYFAAQGHLYLEIGCTQARAVEALMKEHGYTQIRTVKDYAGLDRVVVGEYRQGSSK